MPKPSRGRRTKTGTLPEMPQDKGCHESVISTYFNKMTRKQKYEGLTFYRLRHSFKSYGKRAKDRDALNLCMGHRERTTGEIYDHEEISFKRIKRVAMIVYRQLWPKPK